MNSSQVLNKLTIICLQRLKKKNKCGETKGSESECKNIADSKKNYFIWITWDTHDIKNNIEISEKNC